MGVFPMDDQGLCFKCRKDLNKKKEKYVIVQFGKNSRSFHPECHCCKVCDSKLRSGMKYTVEKGTGLCICEPCWLKQHHQGEEYTEMPTASGGVSWKPKAPS